MRDCGHCKGHEVQGMRRWHHKNCVFYRPLPAWEERRRAARDRKRAKITTDEHRVRHRIPLA